MNSSDWIGFAGVSTLLLAFVLNLSKKIPVNSVVYISLNIIGAALACIASWMIHYIPFIILEGTWTVASIASMWFVLRKK